MKYRYVIALNHMLLTEDKFLNEKRPNYLNKGIKEDEVVELMDYVRRYPRQKIKPQKLFTCGFSKN